MTKVVTDSSRQIDKELILRIAPTNIKSYRTDRRELPAYRFVDLFNAIEALCQNQNETVRIESENSEDLNNLLHEKRQKWISRKFTQASRLPWSVAPEKEVFLPADCFWVIEHDQSQLWIIVRLKYNPLNAQSILEVASPDLPVGEEIMEKIIKISKKDSVYRNQTLEISFDAATKDEYGDVEKPAQLRLKFKRLDLIADEDLIIDEEVRKILHRNVVDLHERRELLKAHKVPIRRGVLFYGPPGTGKTYTCRYLCGKLLRTTRIMVKGSALLQVGHMFQLARLLQPAVIFLEDVDLVFMSREVNLYSSVLGDLLDHMDGLRPFEDIGFVLTTNAIERMEAAVRDRPGRISQCIFFSPPNTELRRRYLSHYLESYDCSKVDLALLVGDSEGATQAFLKEWVHRAVQIASERVTENSSRLELRTDDFKEALKEMRSFTDKTSARIVGFHT